MKLDRRRAPRAVATVAARAAAALRRGGRVRHPQGRHRGHGRLRRGASGREGQGPARLCDGRLRRRRAGPCRRVARALGVPRSSSRRPRVPPRRSASSPRRSPSSGASLPDGAEFSARLRRWRVNGVLQALEAGAAPADRRRRAGGEIGRADRRHAARRPDARDLRAAAGGRPCRGRSRGGSERLRRVYAARYTTPPSGARRSRRSPSASVRRSHATPVPEAVRLAEGLATKRKGHRPAWFGGASSTRPSTIATRSSPGDRIPVRPSSRSARRRPSCRRRHAVSSTTASTCASPSGRRRGPALDHADDAARRGGAADRGRSHRARDHVEPPVTVVEEMWLTVCRTAFSLVISEAQDFACDLLDPRARRWRIRRAPCRCST
jgi:hypothetical protein